MQQAVEPIQVPKPCQERVRLTDEYDRTASEYCRCVGVLSSRLGILVKQDYDDIRRFTEEARKRSERARLDLEHHVAEHGC